MDPFLADHPRPKWTDQLQHTWRVLLAMVNVVERRYSLCWLQDSDNDADIMLTLSDAVSVEFQCLQNHHHNRFTALFPGPSE